MSDHEEYHDLHVGEDSEGEEVVFKDGVEVVENATSSTALTAPPEMVTKSDLHEVIEGWKIKFQKLTEGVCAIQIATEEVYTHMDNLQRDTAARATVPKNVGLSRCKKASRAFWKDATPRTLHQHAPLSHHVRPR